jgi:excisionase family DNA binding protein
MRADDVAAWLAVKRSTVFELSRRRVDPLPSVKIGRGKRFVREDVAEWVRSQRSR